MTFTVELLGGPMDGLIREMPGEPENHPYIEITGIPSPSLIEEMAKEDPTKELPTFVDYYIRDDVEVGNTRMLGNGKIARIYIFEKSDNGDS